MLPIVTVFRSEVKDLNGSRHVRKVKVIPTTGHVNIESAHIGPRGGFNGSYGLGFTEEEWKIIQDRTRQVREHFLEHGVPLANDFFVPGE